jgi:hypothetical protein
MIRIRTLNLEFDKLYLLFIFHALALGAGYGYGLAVGWLRRAVDVGCGLSLVGGIAFNSSLPFHFSTIEKKGRDNNFCIFPFVLFFPAS